MSPAPKQAAKTPPTTRKTTRASAGANKKNTLWARYNSLLVQKPKLMNYTQSILISVAGTITSQSLFHGAIHFADVLKFVALTACFIVPINAWWFPTLGRLKLHWVTAALVDQFLWSPFVMNPLVFWFLNTYDGGVSYDTTSMPGAMSLIFTFNYGKYDSPLTWAPMWPMQLKAYSVWLPATLLREAMVPPHLVPVFVNCVAFVWNILFAYILSS